MFNALQIGICVKTGVNASGQSHDYVSRMGRDVRSSLVHKAVNTHGLSSAKVVSLHCKFLSFWVMN